MVADAFLSPHSTPSQALLSYNSASAQHTYLLTTAPKEKVSSVQVVTSTSNILTSTQVRHTSISEGQINITLSLNFDGMVGQAKYTLIVGTSTEGSPVVKEYRAEQVVEVYGMVVLDGDKIVSGDENKGVIFEQYLTPEDGAKRLRFVRYGPEGSGSVPQARITIRGLLGSDGSDVLEKESVKFVRSDSLSSVQTKGYISIRPNSYRSGGSAMIEIDDESIELNGESFETVIIVSIAKTPMAPAVVKGVSFEGNVSEEGNVEVIVDMCNGKDFVEMEMKLSGNVLVWDKERSTISTWRQRVMFVGNAVTGVYKPTVHGRKASGEWEEVLVRDETRVELVRAAGLGPSVGGGVASVGWIVGGVVLGVGVAAVAGGLVLVMAGRRRSERAEASFASSNGMMGGGMEMYDPVAIARDVYGRGSMLDEV